MKSHLEDPSEKFLRNYGYKEHEYLEKSIQEMEYRQIAESVIRITHKAKIKEANPEILMKALQNRPVLERDNFFKKKAKSEYIYKLEFDESTNLETSWFD